jgi:hypothetical protein
MSFDVSRARFDRNEIPIAAVDGDYAWVGTWDDRLPAVSSSIGHTPVSVSNLPSRARTLKPGLRS